MDNPQANRCIPAANRDFLPNRSSRGLATSNSAVHKCKIEVPGVQTVSGLLHIPPDAYACYVIAHGAGASMAHPFLTSLASGLAEHGVATLRFNFPFMERRSKRPDKPAIAHSAVAAAAEAASRLAPGLPLFAGGKSFGGRMTSQAQASGMLPGVGGLIFVGFPLHSAGTPSCDRAQHLFDVTIPMLFLQGTRDMLADLGLMSSVIARLGARAAMASIDGADHAFHVLVRSGRTDREVLAELAAIIARWMKGISSDLSAPRSL